MSGFKWFKELVFFSSDVRCIVVACDTPIAPDIYPFQILSSFLRQYGSYRQYKISASGDISI